MKPYKPDPLPIEGLNYEKLFKWVGDANSELARYDGLLQGIVNPSLMLSEAVLSSKIEGTQATVEEVLEQEAGLIKEGEKYKDIQEIVNYRKALSSIHNHLQDRPIKLSFICNLHEILMNSVRGQNKTPGRFRTDQKWIGTYGCTIKEASFVPPNHLQLKDHLEDWEKYMKYKDIDVLLQTAVVHAQFELLHPFKDGNGRVGRILIPLFLYHKKKLSQPMFYLSSYLEANREEYYSRLQNISSKKDWNGWIEFFLKAIIEQAENNNNKVKAIMELYDNVKTKFHRIIRSKYSIDLLDAIFDKPTFNRKYLEKNANIPKTSVKSLIPKLKKEGILNEIRPAKGRKPAVFAFEKLINIIRV